ncbi:ABC transporter substrate-binding protein [uncultured Ramlibacter sp.]|uniref:ABC transporter substrate-binding protein n=1 Tax=uncultured Ramlibacter sp. TaxID=260755 RepID=UPI0026162563|nr:ABC transporter substrate-binding protein [uncultured Ramlibacter sp.]
MHILRRLTVLALSASCAWSAAAQPPKTLKLVPHADVKILDPTFTTAYVSRNFGYMVYDTLFALDAAGRPQPQMVDAHKRSADGKTWAFSLRQGLKFSDGSAVTSADVVASLQRWASRDSMGRAMGVAGAQWKAIDARSFELTLQEPFGLVLEALAKPSGFPPMVLPERLARMPTASPLPEVLGSGPYVFKRDEWVPGSKMVFVRNPHYLARKEPPSGLAGSKSSAFDRVEWHYLPDANTAVAALKRGEVDLIEQVPPDHITGLRNERDLKIGSGGAHQAVLILNHLHPPFNHPKARQALAHAVSQAKFTAAMGYPLDMRMTHCATFFICGGPQDTAAGADPFRRPDLAKARQMLAEAGYKGEKVVLLVPSDVTYLNAVAMVAAQTMRSIGMEVDLQTMDWASIGSRRIRKNAPDAGGWNVYASVGGEFDINSPIANVVLGAACGNSLPGWACDPQLDTLRASWIRESDPARRKSLLDAFQIRAYEVAPYVNAGQYSAAFAARSDLKGVDKLWAGLPIAWVLDR